MAPAQILTAPNETEYVVLLDASGKPVGVAPKLAAHHADTPLHRAFSCYIFNKQGRLLVTQRAVSKKVWPGVWTNSVCGHPGPYEKTKSAITRRAYYELGLRIHTIQLALPNYRYQTPPFNGIVENEVCPVYIAQCEDEPRPHANEVDAFEWVAWATYGKQLKRRPSKWSYWAKDQYPQLHAHLNGIPLAAKILR